MELIIARDPFYFSLPHLRAGIIFLTFAFFLMIPLSAGANAGPAIVEEIFEMDLTQLMDMEVVTATRSKVKIKDSPSAIYVITDKQIQERGYRTLIEALEDVPGFNIQHTYGLFPDLIHQRGFVGNNQRSLVYIDGILDNNISENAILGGTSRYPLHNVERIEIVAGPVSALYGPNAFNGVINVITRSGAEFTGNEIQTFAGTWMDDDYVAGGGAFSINGNLTDNEKKFGYSIGGYYLNSDGPDFRNVQGLNDDGLGYWWSDAYNNSDEDTYHLTAKFTFDRFRFETVNWQYLQGDGTFANGTYQIDTDANGFTGSAWDFKSNSVSLGHLADIRPHWTLDSEMVVRHTELLSSSHESYPDNPGPDAYDYPDAVSTVSGYSRPDTSYELEERLRWQPSDRFDATLGLEAIYYEVPDGYGSHERFKYRNYAGYVQNIYRPTDVFSLIGGYRFDYNTAYDDAHTFRMSAVANPGDYTFKALISSGFRAPTAWELLNETRQRKKNPNLDPERMWSAELGAGYTFPAWGHVSFQGYYNVIRDIILEVETTDPNPNPEKEFWNQNQNIGEARVIGVEVNSDINLTDRLTVYANYTYADGKYRKMPSSLIFTPTAQNGNDIPSIPRHKVNGGFSWVIFPDITFHLRANYVGEIRTIQTNPEQRMDDYILFHSHLYWDHFLIDSLYLKLLVRNLFDNDDAFDPGIRTATGSYYPTRHPIEGRNVWLTMGYRF